MDNPGQTYAYVWLVMTSLIALGLIPIIVWAMRTRQFSNQDRARYLPLQSHIPSDEEHEQPPKDEPPADKTKE